MANTTDDISRPAALLEGLELGDGWLAGKRIEKSADATGGNFSCGYLAKHESGRLGFVKALDFSMAFQEVDTSKALERLTSNFNFERDLLDLCTDKRLNRIVTPLFSGGVNVEACRQARTPPSCWAK